MSEAEVFDQADFNTLAPYVLSALDPAVTPRAAALRARAVAWAREGFDLQLGYEEIHQAVNGKAHEVIAEPLLVDDVAHTVMSWLGGHDLFLLLGGLAAVMTEAYGVPDARLINQAQALIDAAELTGSGPVASSPGLDEAGPAGCVFPADQRYRVLFTRIEGVLDEEHRDLLFDLDEMVGVRLSVASAAAWADANDRVGRIEDQLSELRASVVEALGRDGPEETGIEEHVAKLEDRLTLVEDDNAQLRRCLRAIGGLLGDKACLMAERP